MTDLPPLPEAVGFVPGPMPMSVGALLYSEEQMRAYAAAAVAAERERCAKLCDEWASVRSPEHGGLALRNVAERIRASAA